MPSAEIITIGTELLLGQLVDTNSAAIAQALADAGVDVYRQVSVGDNRARIALAVSESLARAEIVMCAGGLGPTVDDLTREAIADALDRPLEPREDVLQELRAYFARLGRTMSDNNALQARFPRGAMTLDNPHGSAKGFAAEQNGRVVVAMPGVPQELVPMLHDAALPWLRRRFGLGSTIVTRVLKTAGLAESDIDVRIGDLFRSGVNPSIAVLAHRGRVDVKITAKAASQEDARSLIEPLERTLRERLSGSVFGVDDQSLEAVVGEALAARGWTIAAAESCTGGLIAQTLTDVPGSSRYFRGGIVAYADDIKQRLLGVDSAALASEGAVSARVAAQMANGARERFSATLGVSTTGIAGPGGATADKPVGLAYVSLAGPDGPERTRELQLGGDRDFIRRRATTAALLMVLDKARDER